MFSRCCLLIEIDKCVARKPLWSFLNLSFAYFGALLHLTMEKLRDRCRSLINSRGCLGCFTTPQLVIAVDEPSKGLKIQGREIKKTNISEDLWSSSPYEMENSTLQSQRSISSMSASNQNLDLHSTGSTSNPPESVNHGLLLWNQVRQQWVGDRRSRDPTKTREPRLSWDATYESLLGTNKPFPQPIPLPEMVDFLVDVWESEGLYD